LPSPLSTGLPPGSTVSSFESSDEQALAADMLETSRPSNVLQRSECRDIMIA
jgi:hypothetical protein